MRLLFALAAACLVPTAASALDCAALASTDLPFAVDYEVTTRAPGKPAVTRRQQVQVFRKAGQVTTYTVDSPAIYLRARGANLFFPVEVLYSTERSRPRRWTYSIDPAADHFARRQPLDFVADMTGVDGKSYLSAKMTLSFGESGTQELGGCRFNAVKVRRTLEGLADRHPIANSSDGWVAPELQVALQSTLRTGEVEVTYTPTAMTTDFKPVE